MHVHARREGVEKEIDGTYDEVVLRFRRNLLDDVRCRITAEAAVAYYSGRFLSAKLGISIALIVASYTSTRGFSL